MAFGLWPVAPPPPPCLAIAWHSFFLLSALSFVSLSISKWERNQMMQREEEQEQDSILRTHSPLSSLLSTLAPFKTQRIDPLLYLFLFSSQPDWTFTKTTRRLGITQRPHQEQVIIKLLLNLKVQFSLNLLRRCESAAATTTTATAETSSPLTRTCWSHSSL